jgi:MoaA/NifB/PqqE/SkfB family radical SAM enzyme
MIFLAEYHANDSVYTAMKELFKDALRITRKNPAQAFFIFRTIKQQQKAFRIRRKWQQKGIQVPPFAILSITNRCNLQCKGCYAMQHHQAESPVSEMSDDKLSGVLSEARELGISVVLLAGGEPLVRPAIFDITKNFREIIFPLFTNGLLLNDATAKILKAQPNVIPVLSIEGYQMETDERRGAGVFENLMKSIKTLHSHRFFFGTSLTLTRENYHTITERTFIKQLIDSGCKLFFFVEYIPVQAGTENLVITESQRSEIVNLMAEFRSKFPALFIAFPGDEERFGGCLAAGRGFIHINAQGGVEPCPFAPFSDADVTKLSLKEALQSNLLKTIRENSDQLKETAGGCALWEKQEWVRSLIK